MKETALVHQIISYLLYKGHKVVRFNTGAARKSYTNTQGFSREHLIRFGSPGWPDIIGYEKGTGQFIGVECKVKGNKPTELQDQVGLEMQANNVIYILAYSLTDVENYFNKREDIQRLRFEGQEAA